MTKMAKINPEQVALSLSGRMKILTEKELLKEHRMGGKLPRHAHFVIKLPDGWEVALPWKGLIDNEDGTVTLLLNEES